MKNKRGVALVWVLVVCVVMMTISASMSDFIIKESQLTTDVTLSSNSLSAAQAGLAWGKQRLEGDNNLTISCASPTVLNIDSSSSVSVCITTTAVAGERLIHSTGTSNKATRKLEFLWKKSFSNIIAGHPNDNGANLTGSIALTGKFEQEYNFWGAPYNERIGLSNSDKTAGVYARFETDASGGNILRLGGHSPGKEKVSTDFIALNDLNYGSRNLQSPYHLLIKFEYIKEMAIKITVSNKQTGTFECRKTLVLDVSDLDIQNLNKLYFNDVICLDTSEEAGDSLVYAMRNSNFDSMTIKGANITPGSALTDCSFVPAGVSDFEDGPSLPEGWNASGYATITNTFSDPVGSVISGAYSAYTRGTYVAPTSHTEHAQDGVLYYDFLVPSGSSTLTFTVRSSIGGTSWDHNRITIYNQSAGGTKIKEWSTPNYGDGGMVTGTSVSYGAATSYTLNLGTAYQGQIIRFYARSHNGGWQASMIIDDVTLSTT